MTSLFLVFLLIQTRPLVAAQTGVVTGTLRTIEGKPAVRIRVAAMVRPENATDLAGGSAMASVAETDDEGHYLLENIPPGHYYIVAGRVDLPTLYPGTGDVTTATALKIEAGETRAGIDFALKEPSAKSLYLDTKNAITTVGAYIRILGPDGRYPVSSSLGPVKLEFTRTLDGLVTETLITATQVSLPVSISPPGAEFRIRVRDLPAGFRVKSILRGPADLTNDTLKIAPSDTTALIQALKLPGVVTPEGIRVPSSSLGFGGVMLMTAGGAPSLALLSNSALGEPLTVTIESEPIPPGNSSGVVVKGIARRSDTHPVYMSGLGGIVFSDGSFEFRNVPPGRHTIATLDSPGRAVGASIVVGSLNLEDVELEDIAIAPADIQTPRAPAPADGLLPGSTVSHKTIRGRVIDQSTQQPVPSGKVVLNSSRSPFYQLSEDGGFEIPHLLPGSYKLEVQIFGYQVIERQIELGLEDVVVNLEAQKLH